MHLLESESIRDMIQIHSNLQDWEAAHCLIQLPHCYCTCYRHLQSLKAFVPNDNVVYIPLTKSILSQSETVQHVLCLFKKADIINCNCLFIPSLNKFCFAVSGSNKYSSKKIFNPKIIQERHRCKHQRASKLSFKQNLRVCST